MSRLERKCLFVELLLSLPKAERNKVLKIICKPCIDTLRDCCKNILQNKIPIKAEVKQRLKTHKDKLRAVASHRIRSEEARKLFQTGGFFQALIPVLASIINPILSALTK